MVYLKYSKELTEENTGSKKKVYKDDQFKNMYLKFIAFPYARNNQLENII